MHRPRLAKWMRLRRFTYLSRATKSTLGRGQGRGGTGNASEAHREPHGPVAFGPVEFLRGARARRPHPARDLAAQSPASAKISQVSGYEVRIVRIHNPVLLTIRYPLSRNSLERSFQHKSLTQD